MKKLSKEMQILHTISLCSVLFCFLHLVRTTPHHTTTVTQLIVIDVVVTMRVVGRSVWKVQTAT
jgi:hypothetical protein